MKFAEMPSKKKGDKALLGGPQTLASHQMTLNEQIDEILERRKWTATDMRNLRELIPKAIQKINPETGHRDQDELASEKDANIFEMLGGKNLFASNIDSETENDLLQELKRVKQDAAEREQRIKELEHIQAERQIKDLKHIQNDIAEKEHWNKEMEQFQEKLAEKERQVKELECAKEDLQLVAKAIKQKECRIKELEGTQKDLDYLKKTVEEKDCRIKDLKGVQGDLDHVKEKAKEKDRRIKELESAQEGLDHIKQKLEAEKRRVKELEGIQEDLNRIKQKLEAREHRIKELESIQENLPQKESRIKELEQVYKRLEEKERRIGELEIVQSDLGQVKEELEKKNRRITELDQVQEDVTKRERYIKELERVRSAVVEKDRQIKKLALQVDGIKMDRDKQEENIKALQIEAENANETKRKLEDQITKNGDLARLLQGKSDEKENLEEILKGLQELNRTLQKNSSENIVSSGRLALLRDERDRLRQDTQKAGDQINKMKSEIGDLKRTVGERDKVIDDTKEGIRRLDRKIQEQSEQEETYKVSISELQDQLSALTSLEMESKMESLISKHKAEIQTLQLQLQNQGKLLEQKVKEEILKLQKEAKDQKELLTASKRKIYDLEREAKNQKKTVEVCTSEANERERLSNKLRELIVASKTETERLQREVDKQKKLVAASETETQRLRGEINERLGLLGELQELVAIYKSEANRLQREFDEQKQQTDEESGVAATSKIEIQRLQKDARERERLLKELQETIVVYKSEILTLRREADGQKGLVMVSEIRIQKLLKEVEGLQTAAKRYQKEADEWKQYSSDQKQQVDEQKELAEVSSRETIERGRRLHESLGRAAEILRQQLEDEKKNSEKLKQQVGELRKENIRQEAEIDRFDQQREKDKRKNQIDIQEKEARFKEQEDKCHLLEKKIERCRETITDLKERLEESLGLKKGEKSPASELLEHNIKLEEKLSAQEAKVMHAQEAAMDILKTKEALRYKFLPNSFIRSEIYASLEVRPEEWARKYAIQHFDLNIATKASSELHREFEKIGKKRCFQDLVSRASPQIALLVLLVHFITENVLRKPFLRLSVCVNEGFAVNLQTLYEGFQKAADENPKEKAHERVNMEGVEECKEKAASIWRSQTLEMLSRQWVRSLDKSQGTERSRARTRARAIEGIDEFPFPAGQDLADKFIEGPAALLLDPSTNTKERHASLVDVIREAAWVAFMLWRQRAQLDIGGYDEWKDVKYTPQSLNSKCVDGHWSQLEPENFLRSGAEVGVIVQPSITASWVEDGKKKEKVWRTAVALWRGCGFNDIEDDEEYEDDSDEFPDIPL